MKHPVIIGALSHAGAAAAYAALALAVLVRWRHAIYRHALAVALVVSALWAASAAIDAVGATASASITAALDVLRDGAWLYCLLLALRAAPTGAPPSYAVSAIWSVAGLLFAAIVASALAGAAPLLGQLIALLQLALALIGFVLAEQTYRNTRVEHAWAAKFLWLSVGGLFLYDVLLYSMKLTFAQTVPLLWEARGAVHTLLLPVMAVGVARLNRASSMQLLSPRLMFYSTGALAAGVYLVVVALAGYYLQIVGGSWGEFLRLLFVAAALLMLAVVVVSGHARASLRVFVTKHLHPYKYDYRREWLRVVRTMDADSGQRSLADRAVAALGQLVDADLGGLWLLQDGQFVPVGGEMAGSLARAQPADPQFVAALCRSEWIIDLHDARAGDGGTESLVVPAWLLEQKRARLVVPLLQETRLIGLLTLGGTLAEHALGWEDIDLLRAAGRQVSSYVALESAARKLSEAQQFEAYNRFAAFVMHDLKNLIAQQRLVVENAVRHKSNPAFVDDAIATIDNSVRRMSRLLGQLRRGEVGGDERRVNLAALCNDVANRCARRAPVPRLAVADDSIEIVLSPERFASVLENLVANAQEATPADGSVRIEVSRGTDCALVVVRDSGEGMNEEFVRERLFRPFDTTKGSQGMGIGAYLAREFVRGLGGEVEVDSAPGRGTRFVIELPISRGGA